MMPPPVDPKKARQFAFQVVQRLVHSGYEAYWAGGCVRDQLLGIEPHDYDVATNAKPDEIRRCFSRRRTLPLGAAFGVITVLGHPGEGHIEIATFRRDLGYSDGRHPDDVAFSTAQQDAQRRDFTINGLFFDPLNGRIIDYVGGREDLKTGVIRAIGDPTQRIREDRLRMLRAARFAARFQFSIDPATHEVIKQNADHIIDVSAERIATELRRMLVHEQRARAITLLRQLALLPVILPESRALRDRDSQHDAASDAVRKPSWHRTLDLLTALRQPTFPVALAGLLHEISQNADNPRQLAEQIGRRWKLSNAEIKRTRWILATEATVRQADRRPWPEVQRILIAPYVDELMVFADAVARVHADGESGVVFCREKLQLPPAELNPAPLVTGDDLRQAGFSPNPAFRTILTQLRDRQLLGQLTSKSAALEAARQLARELESWNV